MIKQYSFYMYTWDLQFLEQINEKNIISEVSYTEAVDWWQGQCKFKVVFEKKVKEENWEQYVDLLWKYQVWNILEITELAVESWNLEEYPAYSWVIVSIWIEEYKENIVLDITLNWIFTLLNNILYNFNTSWWYSFKWTLTWTWEEILTEILRAFNEEYPIRWEWKFLGKNWTILSIRSAYLTQQIEIKVKWESCYSVFRNVINQTNWWGFTTRATWEILINTWFYRDPYTFEKEVLKYSRNIDIKDLANFVATDPDVKNTISPSITRQGRTRDWIWRRYNNYRYIWMYMVINFDKSTNQEFSYNVWTSENPTYVRQEFGNIDWINRLCEQYLESHKYPNQDIKIYMKPQLDDSLHPWDRITVNNTPYSMYWEDTEDKKYWFRYWFKDLLVSKIEKNSKEWIVHVWDLRNTWTTIWKYFNRK